MCKYCSEHSQPGVKWYLSPESFQFTDRELLKNNFEQVFQEKGRKWLVENAEKTDTLLRMESIGPIFQDYQSEEWAENGQIVPLDDALRILDLGENYFLVPCSCRKLAGIEDNFYCLHFGVAKEFYQELVADSKNRIDITREEAKTKVSEWDAAGFYHLLLLWKDPFPYLYNMCSCSSPYCYPWKWITVHKDDRAILKGEYLAMVDPDVCSGCESCVARCHFGAIRFDRIKKKAFINMRQCYGCGLCETGCEFGAINLVDRLKTPARQLW
ncbi:MAG: 4Fe-4S dicluster domain-containing protein [Candidatus Hodarchaeales archaeon]|jgi:NAD-dependent dihydropyrimidine dehydrogenase PreA subunit